MALCKRRLLQCATPEAVVHVSQTELKDEAEEIRQIYMEEQQHESLLEYLDVRLKDNEVQQNAFIQVSTKCSHISPLYKSLMCQLKPFWQAQYMGNEVALITKCKTGMQL